MKGLLIICLFALVSLKGNAQSLKIRVYNKTGFDLDSVTISKNYIGKIPKDSSKLVLSIQGIEMQDEFPFIIQPGGIIKNKKKFRDSARHTYCGTGVEMVESGNFEWDIKLLEKDSGYFLYWDKHAGR